MPAACWVVIRCDGGAGFGQGLFINKLLGHWGNRKSFERGALISMLSFAIQGLCFLAGPLNWTVPQGWRANLLCGTLVLFAQAHACSGFARASEMLTEGGWGGV